MRVEARDLLVMLEQATRDVAAERAAPRRAHQPSDAGLFTMITMLVRGQKAEAGALASLYSATGEVGSGEFFGPRAKFNMNGPPVEVRLPKRAKDVATARALWQALERLTGVTYDFGAPLRTSD
jgi:hypothetical protein